MKKKETIEVLNKDYKIIKYIWNELKVSENYKEQFDKYIKTIKDENNLKEFFELEKKDLKELKDEKYKLSKEILNRENNIQILHKLCELLKNKNLNLENDSNNYLFNEITSIIKALRINSVNCINLIKKIKELYNSKIGKYNINRVYKEHLYDNGYILKMKKDMKFLENTILNKYYEMSHGEIDAFLTNFASSNNKTSNKISIPIEDNLLCLINDCKYELIEDLLFYQKNNIKFNINNKLLNNNDNDLLTRNNFLKQIDEIEDITKKGKKVIKMKNKVSKNIEKNNNQNKQIDIKEIINKEEENKKITEQQIKEKKIEENNSEINNQNLIKKDNIDNKNKIIKNDNKKQTYDKNIKNEKNKIKEKMTKEKKIEKPKLIEEKKEIEKKNTDIKNKNIKEKEINEKKKIEEKKTNIQNMQEEKTQSDVKLDVNIVSKSSYSEFEYVEQNENNEEEEEEKEEEEEEEEEDKENNNELNESENNGFKIKFYKGKIDDLIQIINNPNNNYIKSIKDFQLTSFNITEKSFEFNNLTSGIFPKIIISLYENEIKGLCKLSFSSLNKPITIRLDHLSSIDVNENLNEWALQIHLIMNFIYKNIEFNEIEFIIENTMSENIYYLFTENFGFKLISEDNKNKFKLYYSETNFLDNSIFFSFNSLSLMTFSLMKSFNDSEIEKFINLFNILCVISKEKSFGLIKTEILNPNIFELNINDIESILNKSLELIIQCSGLDYVKQYIEEKMEDEIYLNDLLYNGRDDCDIITYKLIYSLPNLMSIKYHKTYYNRINNDLEIIYNKIHQNNIYLIPTNNSNIYLIIVEINKEFNEQIIQKNNNIYESIYTILKDNYNDKKKLNKNIYIPSFNINRHLKQEGLNEINSKIKITKNSGSNIYISILNEFYNINFNNDKNIENNFKVQKNKDDIIIKDSFLFGIYYKKLHDTNNIPIVGLYMITQFYWNTIYN